MKNIVVLTGSFNPITKAHRIVLEKAIEKINAELGLLVVTNDAYLTKKNLVDSKKPTAFHLSESVRQSMIESLTEMNPKIKFGGAELGNENPSTIRTLKSLKKKYSQYKIYFVVGADKLNGIAHWTDIENLFNDFGFVVFQREGIDIDAIINNDELLSKYRTNFVIMDDIPEIKGISSTNIRNRFFNNEDYSDLMDDGPKAILSRYTPKDFPQPTDEEIIKATIEYGGRFGGNLARTRVFKCNAKLFKDWNNGILGDRDSLLNGTKVYNAESTFSPTANTYNTIFDCVNEDCADVAEGMIKENYNPVILNLASNVKPCGGYNKGSNAQEESLCYMSTLSQSLYQFGNVEYKHIKESGLPNYPDIYPMDINFGGIYSPNVTFFRNNLDKFYSMRKNTFACSVVTVASLANKESRDFNYDERKYFNSDGTLNNEGKAIESNKIRTIFRIALSNNHDAIILGAFGCGVYNLLPTEISQLFKDILEENEFKNRFRKVVFAIYEGKGSKRKVVGEEGKFKAFYDLFA